MPALPPVIRAILSCRRGVDMNAFPREVKSGRWKGYHRNFAAEMRQAPGTRIISCNMYPQAAVIGGREMLRLTWTETIEAGRILEEQLPLVGEVFARNDFPRHLYPAPQTGVDQADRPIAPPYDAIPSEGCKAVFHVRPNGLRNVLPWTTVRHHARNLARDIRLARKSRIWTRHSLKSPPWISGTPQWSRTN